MIFTMGNGGILQPPAIWHAIFSKNTRVHTSGDSHMSHDCMPTLTAFANDEGYEISSFRATESSCEPGDILIAISGSGNSMNILRGLEARENSD
jgi:D-sedoheptulose 7-phosphate isomerase